MSIADWPESDRPRERLLKHGPSRLSDAELLAIFLRTGAPGKSAVDLSREVLSSSGSLRALLELTQEDFCQFRGLGSVTYALLQAALEVGQRYLKANLVAKPIIVSRTHAAIEYLTVKLRHLQYECFAALYLDSQNQLIDYIELANGTINASAVYPREVVKSALSYNAVSVIFAHNHPSGRAQASESDRDLTVVLVKALKTVDIAVFDHIVIGDGEHFSFAQNGWL